MLILPLGYQCGLTPHAYAGTIERPITNVSWSAQSATAAVELNISTAVFNAACVKGMALGVAQVRVDTFSDGRPFTQTIDIQVVSQMVSP